VELQGASYNPQVYLREALTLREELLPPQHLDLAQTRSELGGFIANWQPGEGKALLVRALDVQRPALGNGHPDVARTIGFLARATLGLGDAEGAEKLARESIESFRQAYDPATTESLASERTLGYSLRNQQRHAEAEPLIRAAIDRSQRLLSPAHPMNADLRLDLSHNLWAQQRVPEAEAVAREALELAQRYDLPGPAGQILQAVNGLLRQQKRYAEAEEITRRQIALTRPRATEYPLMLALHLAQLTGLLRLQDRYAEAEISSRETLALRESADRKGWLTQSSRSSVGAILTRLGRHAEAEPFLLSAVETLTELDREFPQQTPTYFRGAYAALVELYQKWGRLDDMQKWNDHARAYVQELRARGRPMVADLLAADLEKIKAASTSPERATSFPIRPDTNVP
jgi:tetratricopeptide (TPR) repeat protein